MKKASIIMAVLSCAIIAAAYTNSVPISTNTRAATEKWTAIRFEPALPPTPANAESKFLNGNREWQTVAAEQIGAATTQQLAAAVAGMASHTNRADNPHGVTAPQIGALTAEQDLAALRAYHYGSTDIVESPAEWFVFNGSGTITAFNSSAGRENVVIPWAIGGVPVTTIGAGAFQESGIVSLIAPQTVTMIGASSFSGCTELVSVSLPQAQTISDSAFYYCGLLASVSLPQAQTIGNYAFRTCGWLASVSLPQATSIGDYAFNYCGSLTSVNLPQAQTISDSVFAECPLLTSVRMGWNAPSEAVYVFYGITPPPNVYVTDPQATGWGAEWNGAPVVRPPLYADAVYQAGERVPSVAAIQGIVYSNSVSQMVVWTNSFGAVTNMARLEGGTWITNAFGAGEPLPEGIVTNGADGPLALAGIGLTNGVLRAASGRLGRITLDDNGIHDVVWGTVFSTQSALQIGIEGSAHIGGFFDYPNRFHGKENGTEKVLEVYDYKYGPRTAYFDHDGSIMSSGTVSAASAILRDSGQPVSWEFSVSNGLFYASTNGVRAYKLTVEEP